MYVQVEMKKFNHTTPVTYLSCVIDKLNKMAHKPKFTQIPREILEVLTTKSGKNITSITKNM